MTPAAAALSAILLAADPAGLDLNFPTTDFADPSGCLVTVVTLEDHVRLRVSQVAFETLGPDARVKDRRPSSETTLADLPGVLAHLKPNRCEALVLAPATMPWRDVGPVYGALRAAGYRDFMTAPWVTK